MAVGPAADPLTITDNDFAKDLNVNVLSAYAAASTAADTFTRVSSSLPKVFIYTGNMCSYTVVPEVMSMGVSKNAMVYVMQTAAEQYVVKGKGEKGFWYFAG